MGKKRNERCLLKGLMRETDDIAVLRNSKIKVWTVIHLCLQYGKVIRWKKQRTIFFVKATEHLCIASYTEIEQEKPFLAWR